MHEMKAFGVETFCYTITTLEKSSLKFRQGFIFVVFIHPRK